MANVNGGRKSQPHPQEARKHSPVSRSATTRLADPCDLLLRIRLVPTICCYASAHLLPPSATDMLPKTHRDLLSWPLICYQVPLICWTKAQASNSNRVSPFCVLNFKAFMVYMVIIQQIDPIRLELTRTQSNPYLIRTWSYLNSIRFFDPILIYIGSGSGCKLGLHSD